MKKIVISLLFLTAFNAYADNQWYLGKLTRVWAQSDGQFIVTLDSPALSDCLHNYAYFRTPVITQEYLNKLYATSISAYHAKSNVGIIIDKANLNNGICEATSIDLR